MVLQRNYNSKDEAIIQQLPQRGSQQGGLSYGKAFPSTITAFRDGCPPVWHCSSTGSNWRKGYFMWTLLSILMKSGICRYSLRMACLTWKILKVTEMVHDVSRMYPRRFFWWRKQQNASTLPTTKFFLLFYSGGCIPDARAEVVEEGAKLEERGGRQSAPSLGTSAKNTVIKRQKGRSARWKEKQLWETKDLLFLVSPWDVPANDRGVLIFLPQCLQRYRACCFLPLLVLHCIIIISES